ncbi:hypothetical protein CLV82_2173 [Zeaxanthinibacter enoshimensis]|uniref:Uncharacterized protein n=2 Tax=Zeaxanthinibacter enoshimensis TaxID=392009 RepID=A0A4R6TPC2_9FLAO|nr:hypothetical protein CLV82_2173 [Zeaxanthinibacter enoshimensis]
MLLFHKPKVRVEFFTALAIVFIPFLIFIHLAFSEKSTLNILGWQFEHGFGSNELFIWMILLKLIPIIMLSIWFVTNYFKWRYFTLIPIILFSDSLIRYNLFAFIQNDLLSVILSLFINSIIIYVLFRLNQSYLSNINEVFDRTSLQKLIINDSKKFYEGLLDTLREEKKFQSMRKIDDYKNRLVFTRGMISERLLAGSIGRPSVSRITKLIAISILLILPIIYNLHRFIPSGTTTLNLYLVEIGTFDFPDINTMVWLVMLNLVYILPLFIWFITCPYWWRYAILAPIILSTFQLWELFYEIDIYEWRNLNTIPYLLIIISILVYASEKVKYEVKLSEIQNELDIELTNLIKFLSEDSTLTTVRNKLDRIRDKENLNEADKLEELIRLREQILTVIRQKEGE